MHHGLPRPGPTGHSTCGIIAERPLARPKCLPASESRRAATWPELCSSCDPSCRVSCRPSRRVAAQGFPVFAVKLQSRRPRLGSTRSCRENGESEIHALGEQLGVPVSVKTSPLRLARGADEARPAAALRPSIRIARGRTPLLTLGRRSLLSDSLQH